MKKNIILLIILILLCITLLAACNGSKSVVSISIFAEPDKTTYIVGEELDIVGCKITVTYANGDTNTVNVTESMVSGFDTSAIGTRSITITYKHSGGVYTTTQEIRTVGRRASSITIITPPTKNSYAKGELITLEGIVVDVVYNNGDIGTVGSSSLTATPVQAQLGNTVVTVKLDNATATYNITVTDIEVVGLSILQLPDKTVYFAGELFDETGLMLNVVFNNSTSQQLTEGFTILEHTLTIDTTGVMIRHGNIEIECPITVLPAEAVDFTINNLPKVNYHVDESIDFDGLNMSVHFNNGNSIVIEYDNGGMHRVNWDTVEVISPLSALKIDDNYITLHYSYGEGATDYLEIKIEITVTLPTLTGFVLMRDEFFQKVYIDGDAINLLGLELNALYSNGDSITIINDEVIDIDVSYPLTAVLGMTNIVFQYKGLSYEYPIIVNPAE